MFNDDIEECPVCEGEGYMYNHFGDEEVVCYECDGLGFLEKWDEQWQK